MTISSAAGLIALLDDTENASKSFALKKLDALADTFWTEISDVVAKLEVLYEDQSFEDHKLAALVASKVYFHLGDLKEAMTMALGAGELFDVDNKSRSEFVETVISKCIDRYIEQRAELEDSAIDPRLVDVVERMFARCLSSKSHRQAIGIALESRRLDRFATAIVESPDQDSTLEFALRVTLQNVLNRQFRNNVLGTLVDLFLARPHRNYALIFECLVILDQPMRVAELVNELISSGSSLIAYQLAFDLYDTAPQHFLKIVIDDVTVEDKKLLSILTGEETVALHREFLYRNNKTDLLVLNNLKEQARLAVVHSGTVIANGLAHAGTSSDQFLRDNMEWLQRAINWSKFSAVASLGVIHKGDIKNSTTLFSSYLPAAGSASNTSPYAEGGALYGLGLIHTNHGKDIIQTLRDRLAATQSEIVQHGGCLGLGCAAMGTNNMEAYNDLKDKLYGDHANVGEAAGLAMGLVMLGSGDATALEDMVKYAQETQHEKIIRGLAMGIGLVVYGREESAEPLIEQLIADKDPLVRTSAMYACAMAYAGTGNNAAIRRLLHVGVSDVSDDVRRAAVTGLGFLLLRNPSKCPAVVSLLSESYNPHVRYGAALALGIACAGTGLKEALALLEPLSNDSVDYVRQGSMMAMAMVLIQQSEAQNPKVSTFRKQLEKVVGDKHEDSMAKFGAAIAQGLIDAGGRNVTIALQTRSGHLNAQAIVGLLVSSQFWYWHPFIHFISLSFTPTCVIALNKDLKMPKTQFVSNAKASLFAYPPNIEPPKVETREKVSTAILSFSAKPKTKSKTKESTSTAAANTSATEIRKESTSSKKDANAMDTSTSEVEMKKADESTASVTAPAAAGKEKKEDPPSTIVENPGRVVPQQVKFVSFPENSRYTTVIKNTALYGIVILDDNRPEEEETLITLSVPKPPASATANAAADDGAVEPGPFEPFEYLD